MSWMLDEYETMMHWHAPGLITGKPLEIGGSPGRGDATARGGMYTLREAAKTLEIDLSKATAAIQGYGNAGSYAHQLIREMFGTKVVAVTDSKGGCYRESGFEYEEVQEFKDKHGTVMGMPNTTPLDNRQILELDADVLIPAALENVLRKDNAGNVKAKIIAELANGPTTPEADQILHENGKFVIPDFLCNAGGVTVSYFEQVQNYSLDRWKLSEIHERLDDIMTEAFHAVLDTRTKMKVHTRLAAYLVAIERVATACRIRGWVGPQKPKSAETKQPVGV
jgi:glutamate dehydrogenase (NAD(P)+)